MVRAVRRARTEIEDEAESREREDMCLERAIHPEDMQAVRRNTLQLTRAARTARLFSVLSDPTRVQVLYALLHAPSGELCVCDLAAGLCRDDTTISHQLRVLRNQQIVSMRKVGRIVYYRLIDEHVRQLLELGLAHADEPVQLDVRDAKEALL